MPERTIVRGTRGYPDALLDLPDPPVALHVRGELPADGRWVAIVGSRAATGYGERVARRLAADLAGLGFAVVSGLARGIDAAAHRGALEAGGRTVAVLPGGVDEVTPRHHRELAAAIVARGALVSEMPAGTTVRRGHFIERNRLIAALAQATVVVEAAERSGALSTAGVARRLGRALLAVPGDIDRPQSRGCHALLRAGALPCETAGDVVRALTEARRVDRAPRAASRLAPAPTPEERTLRLPPGARLMAALEGRPAPLERLAERAELEAGEALAALLELEWSGVAVAFPGQRWARRPEPGA